MPVVRFSWDALAGEHPSRGRPAGPVEKAGRAWSMTATEADVSAGRAGADGIGTDALHRDGGSNGLGVGFVENAPYRQEATGRMAG